MKDGAVQRGDIAGTLFSVSARVAQIPGQDYQTGVPGSALSPGMKTNTAPRHPMPGDANRPISRAAEMLHDLPANACRWPCGGFEDGEHQDLWGARDGRGDQR